MKTISTNQLDFSDDLISNSVSNDEAAEKRRSELDSLIFTLTQMKLSAGLHHQTHHVLIANTSNKMVE